VSFGYFLLFKKSTQKLIVRRDASMIAGFHASSRSTRLSAAPRTIAGCNMEARPMEQKMGH
jgi:hypothetical protein